MGKRIIQQRRGRGTHTYKSPSHRYKGMVLQKKFKNLDKVTKGEIKELLHCPGHNAPLMYVKYEDGEETLMVAPKGVRVGQEVQHGKGSEINPGNILQLKDIPEGTIVNSIEVKPGDGGKLVRNNGSGARIITKQKGKIIIKLPSKKEKVVHEECRAIIGRVAGSGRKEKPIVKAGKAWHMKHARNKLYPITSGVAMNAVDHPFGSGRGRHTGKSVIAPRYAAPGRNVGQLRAKRSGRKKR